MTNYQINEMNAEVAQQFGKLIAERDALKAKLSASEAALHRFQHGQQIEGDYVCEAAEKERAARLKAEAACASLTNGIEEAWETRPIAADSIPLGSFIDKCVTVARGDAGRGWHSPQEWEAVQAEKSKAEAACAAMMTALRDYVTNPHTATSIRGGVHSDGFCKKCAHQYANANAALATDAGQNVTDFIAAARRLNDGVKLFIKVMNGARMSELDKCPTFDQLVRDVDAAEAKLGGSL